MSIGGQAPIGANEVVSPRPDTHFPWSNTLNSLRIEGRGEDASFVLTHLQDSLSRHLLRLEVVASRLQQAALARRLGAGRRAVRQIERERQRLGRELHTGVGQALAAISIQLEIIYEQLPNPADGVHRALQHIGVLAGQALDEVRGVSRELYAPAWQALPLDQALRQVWESSGISQRLAATIEAFPLPNEPDPEVKAILYRTAQEALSNVIRHSHATRIDLTLSSGPDRIQMIVHDNGVGFDATRVLAEVGGGIGLHSLTEQAADLGGKFSITSTPEGTTLEVSVPIEL